MKSVEIELAGKQYVIQELPSRKNQAWRETLRGEFGELVDVLMRAPGIEVSSAGGMAAVGQLMQIMVAKVTGAIDILRDRLIDYSPKLQADREHLLENGYDSEFMSAFVEVLRLAFPFGSVVDLAGAAIAKAGQQTKKT
jgi:hypothetical protein